MLLSSFTDSVNHLVNELCLIIYHFICILKFPTLNSTKRCTPAWTCGKDKNSTILHVLPKPTQLLFCLCSEKSSLFHVYLACGKKGQHPGTRFFTPERHWKSWTVDGSLRTCWPIPFDPAPSEDRGAARPRLMLCKPAVWLLLPGHTGVKGMMVFLPTGHWCIVKFLPMFMQEPLISPFFWMWINKTWSITERISLCYCPPAMEALKCP